MRSRIPISIAALGPKSVEQAAEIAEAWQPIFFHPERADRVWGAALAAGQAKRDGAMPPLEIHASPVLCIGEKAEALLPQLKPQLALYIGGMGARGTNFYNDLVRSYGYEAEAELIQDLYLAGRKDEAAAAVPDELVRAISLVGPKSYVAERLAAFAEAGVTSLNVVPLAEDAVGRLAQIAALKELVGDLPAG